MTDRQRIIENNRSLRNIKNELETLLEKGVISEDVFDSISTQLPAESPLSASATSTPVASLAAAATATSAFPRPLPPRNPPSVRGPGATVAAAASVLSNLNLAQQPHQAAASAPPAYSQTPPPPLPARNAPAAAAPEKPILAHARALYKYEAADARDVALERDDRIAVYDYVNDQWWMGRNLRTSAEGIFPKTYVMVEHEKPAGHRPPPPPVPGASSMAPVSMATLGNVGGPPAHQAPYDPNAPQQSPGEPAQPSKLEQNGKKIGKKLGNAAIFGAGATIGSNLVNSIF
jgi:hypothetical protein